MWSPNKPMVLRYGIICGIIYHIRHLKFPTPPPTAQHNTAWAQHEHIRYLASPGPKVQNLAEDSAKIAWKVKFVIIRHVFYHVKESNDDVSKRPDGHPRGVLHLRGRFWLLKEREGLRKARASAASTTKPERQNKHTSRVFEDSTIHIGHGISAELLREVIFLSPPPRGGTGFSN